MFLKKATAIALLALAPTLLAACGGSDGGDLAGTAIEDPSNPPVEPVVPGGVQPPPAELPGANKPAPVVPGSASGASVTLLGYVQGLAPTRRVDLADMRDACKASPECQADIAKFEAHLLTLCPVQADCKDAVGMLLYKERSPQQVAQQLYSASIPQSKDVAPVVEAALVADAGAGGDEKAADPNAAPDAATVETLTVAAEDLKTQAGTEVSWIQIEDMIIKIDPATGNAVTEYIQKELAELPAEPEFAETVTKLLAGESVDSADAAIVIQAIIDAQAHP